MPRKSREGTFDSDSSDDGYYFEPDKIEDDDGASDNENELRSTRNRFRRFNISSDSDSDDELNIEENNRSLDNE